MVKPVTAGTILVNSTLDIEANDGLCTLREAIKAANSDTTSGGAHGECAAGSGEDVITLPAGEYTLTATLPIVSTKMTIEGAGAHTTIIQASTCDPINLPGGCTPANNYRILVVNVNGDLTLGGVTVRYGNLTDSNSGGAIEIYNTLHLVDSIVAKNSAQSGGGIFVRNGATAVLTSTRLLGNQASGIGGGIRNLGTLVATDIAFDENRSLTSQGGGIHSSANGSVEITNASFANNFAHISGGGIFLQSSAGIMNVITGSDFLENETGSYGGGIYNSSNCSLEITDSMLVDNLANAYYGGGIANYGAIEVMGTTFTGNTADSGGGMYVSSASTQNAITNSTFTDNIATNYGGAISSHGSLVISDSHFEGNQAEIYYGGAISLSGTAASSVLEDSTLAGNIAVHGGGLLVYGTLEVTGSTFVDNRALGTANNGNGGAILNQGSLEISNSTFSGNTAFIGGGVFNNPGKSVILTHCTLSGNQASSGQGAGLYNYTDATLSFANTIIANSVSSTDCVNYGSITVNSHNLVEDGTCSVNAVGFLSGDPALAALGDNGGPTLTHALMAGSPAIDAADPDYCVPTDQRGMPRPQGAICDIGAFEFSTHTPVEADFSGSPTSGDAPLSVTFTNLSIGDYDTCTWTFGDGGNSTACVNPLNEYSIPGVYTVSLTVSGPGGTDSRTRINYITVQGEPPVGHNIFLPLVKR
jgi:CSLREA domain-containing protein